MLVTSFLLVLTVSLQHVLNLYGEEISVTSNDITTATTSFERNSSHDQTTFSTTTSTSTTTATTLATTTSFSSTYSSDSVTNNLVQTTSSFIDSFGVKCLSINQSASPTLTLNTSKTDIGTVVQATCQSPYRLFSVDNPTLRTYIFFCDGGLWSPYTPKCLPAAPESNNTVGIIIGCIFGGLVGLAIIIGAIVLWHKMRKDRIAMYEKQEEYDTKMSRINDFVMSTFDDSVGMPPVTMETRSSDMRGIPMEFMEDKFDVASSGSSSPPEVEETTLHLY